MIYFARAGDTVKIGRSGDPERRVTQLRTAAPALRLICDFDFVAASNPFGEMECPEVGCACEGCHGWRRAETHFEKRLHWHFDYCCVGGENFKTNPHLEDVILAFRGDEHAAFVEFENIHYRAATSVTILSNRSVKPFSFSDSDTHRVVGEACAGLVTPSPGSRNVESAIVASLINQGAMTKYVKPI